MPSISVIIPALNEAPCLPLLLAALRGQTRPPDEIIVADAGSTDSTVELARAAGCQVVSGGMPARGRNAGAAVATGDVLVFLDADVLPAVSFLAVALAGFLRSGCAVATCPLELLDKGLDYRVMTEAANLYMRLMRPISPRAPGACLFIRRATHEAIGGFDETLLLCEDHDYVRRAARHGPVEAGRYGGFAILGGARIPVSVRRVKSEGIASLAIKYVWCEAHLFVGKPVRRLPFRYEFGHFEAGATVAAEQEAATAHLLRDLVARAEEWVPVDEVRDLAQRAEDLLSPEVLAALAQRAEEWVSAESVRELAQRAAKVIHNPDDLDHWL